MGTQRITITLPDRTAEALRKESRETGKPVSQLVAEALREREEENIRELMIEGARESSRINRELAEEFWPIAGETWPDD